jgi:hypothetical protein
MIIHIEDRGVGMPAEMVERYNQRLASPDKVEPTTFRQMGLAVVARLAARYQIQVELRSQPGYGTIAYVMLPSSILVMPRARHARPELAPTGPAIMDSQQPTGSYGAVVPAGSATGGYGQQLAVAQATGQAGVYQGGVYQSSQAGGVYQSTATQGAMAATRTQVAVSGGQDQAAAPAGGGQTSGQGFSFWSTPATAGNTGATATAESTTSSWQTPADAGWRAAAAAARPQTHGMTPAGLPKRIPQAQLVPGSVSTPNPVPAPRRSPESARGLLSSYQRGVQRGRQGEPR